MKTLPAFLRLLIALIAFVTVISLGVYQSIDVSPSTSKEFTLALLIAIAVICGLILVQLYDMHCSFKKKKKSKR